MPVTTPNPSVITASGAWGAWTTTSLTMYTSGTTVLQATIDDVWDAWYTTTTTTTYTVPAGTPQRPTVSEEARTEARADWERRCRERDEVEAAARARAEALLRMVLSPDELTHYDDTGKVIVTGSQGNRYEIAHGIVGNVYLLDDAGEVVASLCCHPTGPIPHRDSHAAQVLALRNDEELFTATANVEWVRRPARRQMAA